MAPGKRASLVLGSGGARGYAHIGVIQVLEERGFEVAAVAGSSMGALVGGLHAVGQLDAYAEWALGLRQLDVVRLLDLSLSAPGAIRAEKVLTRVRELIDGALIEDLPIPYTAVATDLLAGKEVWFQQGPLDMAIRASIAIPGVITPVMLNGRLLADGGIMNPLPIAPTSSIRTDVTIGVSLSGPDSAPFEDPHEVHETAEPRPVEEWTERFRATASHLLGRDLLRSVLQRFGAAPAAEDEVADDGDTDAGGSGEEVEVPPAPGGEAVGAVFEALPTGLGKFDMMNRSLETMQAVLIRYRQAGYPPDVLIEVPRDACRIVDFHRAGEMIDLGRKLAAEALDRAPSTRAEPEPGPAAGPLEAADRPPDPEPA